MQALVEIDNDVVRMEEELAQQSSSVQLKQKIAKYERKLKEMKEELAALGDVSNVDKYVRELQSQVETKKRKLEVVDEQRKKSKANVSDLQQQLDAFLKKWKGRRG